MTNHIPIALQLVPSDNIVNACSRLILPDVTKEEFRMRETKHHDSCCFALQFVFGQAGRGKMSVLDGISAKKDEEAE
jgi:hypothetical protein